MNVDIRAANRVQRPNRAIAEGDSIGERAGLSATGIQKLERGVTHPLRDPARRLARSIPKTSGTLRAPCNLAGPSVNRAIASRLPLMLDRDWLSLRVREQDPLT
jgi:hypothetical protein